MKIIRLSLHCYQILPIFPSYRMMFLSHLQVDQGIINATMNPVIPTHIPDPAVASPNIGSFLTPCTTPPFHSNSVTNSSFSSKLDSLETKQCGKIMAMKSFFVDELHTIKNESLTSTKIWNTSTNIDHCTVDSLQTKINPLSVNPTKWSNTLKQFVGNVPRNCLSVFDHLVGLALKGLSFWKLKINYSKIM